MTPKEYLGKYCRVSPRRQTLFKRIFEKYQNHHGEIDKEVRRKILFFSLTLFSFLVFRIYPTRCPTLMLARSIRL